MRKVLIWWKEYAYIIMLIIMLIGLIYPMVMLIFIICMISPLLTGYFRGRFWCGNLCPIGNFFDHVTIKISNNKRAPNLFRSKYIRIIFLILMMSMFAFEMITFFGKPVMLGMVFYEMILEATIIGTFLAVIYHHRVWCHFCPMGSTGALMTYISNRKKTLQVTAKCSSCRKCEEKCPMGLAPYEYQDIKLNSHDCIQCGICKDNCSKNAINYEGQVITTGSVNNG